MVGSAEEEGRKCCSQQRTQLVKAQIVHGSLKLGEPRQLRVARVPGFRGYVEICSLSYCAIGLNPEVKG